MIDGQEDFEYVEAPDLYKSIKDKDESIVVIDVRTDDFEGGHISTAENIPADKWEDDSMIENLIQTHKSSNVSTVVFHCMYSQRRGPACARRYLASKSRTMDENGSSVPNVKVLRGGFRSWESHVSSLDQTDEENMICH